MPVLEARMTEDVQTASPKTRVFDAKTFLNAPGIAGRVVDYRPGDTLYAQGDPADTVLYIQHGSVKLSLTSKTGQEAIVGVLDDGDFCGEGALAGQPARVSTASAMAASRIRIIPKAQMIRLLHEQHALADRFISHMLARTGHKIPARRRFPGRVGQVDAGHRNGRACPQHTRRD